MIGKKRRIQWVAVVSGLALCLTACTHVHEYGDWVTVQEATCTEYGRRYHVCSTCGEAVYAVIPAAHTYVEEVCRVCGDGGSAMSEAPVSTEVTVLYPGSSTSSTVSVDAATTTTSPITPFAGVGATESTTTTAPSATTRRSTTVVPTTAGAEDPDWTLAEAHRAVGAAYRAFLAAKTAHTHLTETADAPAVQKMAAVDLAREQIRTAKEQVGATLLLFRQNEALTMAEGGTAAAYAEETMTLCETLLAVATAESTASADHRMAVQTTMDVMLRCSAMEQCVLAYLRADNDA